MALTHFTQHLAPIQVAPLSFVRLEGGPGADEKAPLILGYYQVSTEKPLREAIPKKKIASIWTLSKVGGGGLTRIQIVRGTINKTRLW